MDRLTMAIRRYQQLVPEPVDHAEVPLCHLNIWLREEVNPVLEEFTRRPAFREHASWPIRALYAGAETSERQLIDRVDRELVNCARALLRLANNRLLKQKLQENVASKLVVTEETVQIDGAGARIVSATKGPSFELDIELSQVAAIAERDWSDLVNVNDYFEPQQEWVEDGDGRKIQRGDGVVFLNPQLLPIGNFIVRRMLSRVETKVKVLESLRKRCLRALTQVSPAYRQELTELKTAWSALSGLKKELERIFRTGHESGLRDACITATQIYAAWHPAPELTWLGADSACVNNGIESLRHRLTGWDNAHMFDRIAVALGSLERLYKKMDSGPSAFEEAVAGGGLVIDTSRNMVFWETRTLDKQPSGSEMKLLIALARKAPRRSAVDDRDIWEDKEVGDTAMSTTWGRLKKCLPASLGKLVSPGVERRTYYLDLDTDRIHIFP